jgi:predicted dehydrogenase
VQLFTRDGPAETQGFRTVLTGPLHPPYDRFMPAPGHGLGFNDLKTIECRELIRAIEGQPATILDFADGLAIERTVHAIAGSFEAGRWMEVG